jgi:selenocysteine lyase/cysteine desulfurase
MSPTISEIREIVCGLGQEVPVLGGGRRPYVNLDNAATTPAFRSVADCVAGALEWYSSVHRGTGFKSLLSTHAYDCSRGVVARFVGADPAHHAVIFCSNTTDAINRLCRCFPHKEDDVVLTTIMEHHSNMLPWRFCGKVDYARIKRSDGSLDTEHLESKLREYNGKVRLVAVTGASNITGFIPPIREIASIAHRHGAKVLVDGAQLVAHRSISMGAPGDSASIDFLAFSGHKMYAPFGSGALVGPRQCFEDATPFPVGGGAVELVTLNEIEWADVPEKLEAGTPNLIGVLALAKAIQTLEELGMKNVADHERALTRKALQALAAIPGISVYGDTDPALPRDRVGVIPILAENTNHALLAAILSCEYGIGVRHGCFCAHPYAGQLLGLSDEEMSAYAAQVRAVGHGGLPGFVRISFGVYNTAEDVEYLAQALREIVTRGPRGRYALDASTGQYAPEGFSYDFDSLLGL